MINGYRSITDIMQDGRGRLWLLRVAKTADKTFHIRAAWRAGWSGDEHVLVDEEIRVSSATEAMSRVRSTMTRALLTETQEMLVG